MIPQRPKSNVPPPRRKSPPKPEEIKKGQLHQFWIDRYKHYHVGDKFYVAKAGN